MKSTNLKGKTFAIALILVLTLSSAIAILPIINAQKVAPSDATNAPFNTATPTIGSNGLPNEPTFAGLTVAPDPVGVGQAVQCIMVVQLLPASIGVEAKEGVYGGWSGYVLTITDPNGTSSTLGPYLSDVSGTYQISYTPTSVGTYTFQFTFPGQTDNHIYWGGISGDPLTYTANFLPSTSGKISLTVQQTPAPQYSEAPVPLPTQYWQIPVNGQNRAWNTICGPWLQSSYNATGLFNPYTYAPQSAHILWTQNPYPVSEGNLIGGNYGSVTFGGQNSAVTGFSLACVMGGYAYYNGPTQNTATSPLSPGANGGVSAGVANSYFYCMNIKTGQIIWSAPGSITCGQILDWRSQQQKTDTPYLWSIGSSYKIYSASSGALLCQWNGATPGTVVLEEPHTTVIGEDIGGAGGGGALLTFMTGMQEIYNATTKQWQDPATMWVACWNSTAAVIAYSGTTVWAGQPIPSINPVTYSLPPQPSTLSTLNWNLGIQWNTSFPFVDSDIGEGGVGTYIASTDRSHALAVVGADQNYVILRNTQFYNNATDTNTISLLCFNSLTGALVYNKAEPWPAYTTGSGGSGPGFALVNGGYIIGEDKSSESLVCYSEATGNVLWNVQPFQNDFVMQNMAGGVAAYGNLYNPGYDGYMHAINLATGTQVWDTITRAGGTEMPQPAYPASGAAVADNTVFTSTSKSYEAVPLYRGHCLYAYDATTGAQIWNISGEFSIYCIDDGVLLGANNYDNTVYAFSAGPTATTVTAPNTAVAAGTPIVIQGTVTDQTPGKLQGTPAISDAWMTPWMQYMYMDQAYPHSATGVPVSIDAIDPNGNFVHLGNATSDISGTYSLAWTPPNIPGKYTIIATFNADNSYYGSFGECAAVIASPATGTPAPTATPTSVADMYFVPAIAGLFVLIIVVAIVLALLMLRKRP